MEEIAPQIHQRIEALLRKLDSALLDGNHAAATDWAGAVWSLALALEATKRGED